MKILRVIFLNVLALVLVRCEAPDESQSQFPLEGNWYSIDESSGLEGTDRYKEIYFSKEFFYLNDWVDVSNPAYYFVNNDSVFINDSSFYFTIEKQHKDSVLIKYYDSSYRWLKRLSNSDFMFKDIMLSQEERERLFLERLEKAMEISP